MIPTFNRAADIARVLSALSRHEGPSIEVVVVDNSSTDGTREHVASIQPAWSGRLHYVRKEPEGPAAARNRGLSLAQGRYVLFHDSDVELEPGWIVAAVARLEAAPQLGAVGGHIVYAFDPSRVNAYGGDMGFFGLAWDIDEGAPLAASMEASRIWINCSAMLVRRDAALSAGGFDDSFFYGYEDSDFGWRMRVLGWEVRVVPELVARHHVEAAPGAAHPQIVFHYCKNRLRMLLRNTQGKRLALVLGAYAGYCFADLLLRGPRMPKLRALGWNLRRLPTTWALRRELQAQRRAPDAVIFASGSGRWFPEQPLAGQRRRPVPAPGTARGAPHRGVADDRV